MLYTCTVLIFIGLMAFAQSKFSQNSNVIVVSSSNMENLANQVNNVKEIVLKMQQDFNKSLNQQAQSEQQTALLVELTKCFKTSLGNIQNAITKQTMILQNIPDRQSTGCNQIAGSLSLIQQNFSMSSNQQTAILNNFIQRIDDNREKDQEESKQQTVLLEKLGMMLLTLVDRQSTGFNELANNLSSMREDIHKLVGGLNSTLNKIQQDTNQQLNTCEADRNRFIQILNLMNSKKNCIEATSTTKSSGIYNILIGISNPTVVSVPCSVAYGCGWLVFQRRKDGSVDFNRCWEDYKNGFGDIRGEFFLGLEKLYAITNDAPQELLIVIKDKKNRLYYAKYDEFAIGDESQSYALNVLGRYSGNATDSLSRHKFCKFSTRDRHNGTYKRNCAAKFKSGWWFYDNPEFCYASNLNGLYKEGVIVENSCLGINWNNLYDRNYNFRFSEMLVRPKRT